MDLTTQKRLLTAMTAGFLAVAAVSVVWSLGAIEPTPSQPRAGSDNPLAPQSVRQPTSLMQPTPRSGDPPILSLNVQKPLYDPPKPPTTPRPPKPAVVRTSPPPAKQPGLNWTLTGTLIDSDRSIAILTDATGKTDIRRAGEQVELSPPGVLVRKIGSDSVTLQIGGSESTLRLQSSFESGGAEADDRQNRRRNR